MPIQIQMPWSLTLLSPQPQCRVSSVPSIQISSKHFLGMRGTIKLSQQPWNWLKGAALCPQFIIHYYTEMSLAKIHFFSWCNWYRHILNHWWSCFYKSLILPPSAPIHLNEMRKPWLIHFDRRTCKKYCIKNAKNICEKSQNIWKV